MNVSAVRRLAGVLAVLAGLGCAVALPMATARSIAGTVDARAVLLIGVAGAALSAAGSVLLAYEQFGHLKLARVAGGAALLDAGWLESQGEHGGALLRSLGRDAEVAAGATASRVELALAAVTVAGSVAMLAAIDWVVAATVITSVPVALAVLRVLTTNVEAADHSYSLVSARISAALIDAVRGARTIVAAGKAEHEAGRVLRPLGELRSAGMAGWNAQRRGVVAYEFLMICAQVAGILAAGWSASRGRASVAEVAAAVAYTTGVVGGLVSVLEASLPLTASRAAESRIRALHSRPAALPEPEIPLEPADATIDLDRASVTIADSRVIDDVTVSIAPGETVAVVGTQGAGKSTLLAAIGRLIDVNDGEVRIGGVNVAHIARRRLARAVHYAFDRPNLLGDTIATSLSADRETPRVAAALAAARAEFAMRFGNGLDTEPSEAPMSGGQLQRLGIARALVDDCEILVLDDATSSLDAATEAQIATAIAAQLGRRTTVIATRREPLIRAADRVLWMDSGRLRAIGSHQDLLADPDYRALFAAEPTGAARPVLEMVHF